MIDDIASGPCGDHEIRWCAGEDPGVFYLQKEGPRCVASDQPLGSALESRGFGLFHVFEMFSTNDVFDILARFDFIIF